MTPGTSCENSKASASPTTTGLSGGSLSVAKEVWYLARTPAGDQFVAYVEAEDFAGALSLFSGSQDEFDLWFKRRLADSTGLDLNTPPSGPMPELLSRYTA
jgi:hypothetical protein